MASLKMSISGHAPGSFLRDIDQRVRSPPPKRKTILFPFIKIYSRLIKEAFPDINLIMGTRQPTERDRFRKGVKEQLRHLSTPQPMNDLIRGSVSGSLRVK